MIKGLKHITLAGIKLQNGLTREVTVSYQLYGCTLHTAPIILVNHALTGNSAVTAWWPQVVGDARAIDTSRFTVICIDIPGNGFDSDVEHLIYDYKNWTLSDVAQVFIEALKKLRVCYVHAGIGGSIGGALLWEMTVQAPELFGLIMPIAADWKATDWLIACCHVQQSILTNSMHPIQDARKHAMTFYRTPQSLKLKFNRAKEQQFKVQDWLDYHGRALKDRFTLPAYLHLNHLLTTIHAAPDQGKLMQALGSCETVIHIVSIPTDGFFVPEEDVETYELLTPIKEVYHHYISSVHGHDAFLIEHDQVTALITNCLKSITRNAVASPCY